MTLLQTPKYTSLTVAGVACSYIWLRELDQPGDRLEAFEMKALRQILRVSWIAKKTNSWVLE